MITPTNGPRMGRISNNYYYRPELFVNLRQNINIQPVDEVQPRCQPQRSALTDLAIALAPVMLPLLFR
jgi:hypothetical protein